MDMVNTSNQRSKKLLEELERALRSLEYGSVEIYVQDNTVTQITIRNIKKTSLKINGDVSQVQEEIQRKFHVQRKSKIR